MPDTDTPEATAPRPTTTGGIQTEVALAFIVVGALLLLTGFRIGFKDAVIELGS